MIRTARPPQSRLGRCRPRLERLESRLIFSASTSGDLLATVLAGPVSAFDTTGPTAPGPNLSWTATVPAMGSTVTTAPTTLSITFDRPIDPSFLRGFGDLVVEKPDGAGGWVDVFDLTVNPPAETLDDSGTTLTLTFDQPLAAGTTYQLVIPASSDIQGLDGSTASPDGSDVVAGQFTVAQPGVTLQDAIPVGPVVATPVSVAGVSVAGTLDLQSDPGAVALYTFTLPAGHHWRLATEVIAQRAGGTLLSGLALFDSQGHPIATSSLGRPDALGDAYLYAGLDGGTYYIGVSAYWNLPGKVGGYDPVTGQPGSLPPSLPGQAGGPFHLDIVADRADAPTRLLGFSLNHADPLDPSPTGLTLAFSGLLNLDTLRGVPTSGFEVVNQAGQVFPITAVGYRESSAQYDFLFNQELPTGHYTVRVVDKADGGATDLAGLSPVAPGQPAGVLATFNVKANHNADPQDIGALYDNVHSGLFGDTILPGTAVTYRFVVTVEGAYHFTTQFTGGALSLQLFGPGSLDSSDGWSPGIVQINKATLEPGVYFLQFINQGKSPLHLSWAIIQDTSLDSQLDNGIGQGPALNLRLVNPTSAALSIDTSSTTSGPAMPATSSVQFGPFNAFGSQIAATTATPSGEPASSNASVAPAGLTLTLGNTLVGRPSTESGHVAAVGPSGPAALALSTSGVPQGISLGQLIGRQTSTDPLEGEVETGGALATPEPVNGALAAAAAKGGPRQDEMVIAAADWITRAANGAAEWLVLKPVGDSLPEPPEAGDEAEPIVMTRDDSPVAGRSEGVQQAQFGAPLAIGIASLMAARFNHPFRRWLRKTHGATASSANKAIRGPHRRF
jgi:hypothetical protein